MCIRRIYNHINDHWYPCNLPHCAKRQKYVFIYFYTETSSSIEVKCCIFSVIYLYYLDKTCQRIFERTAERIITYDSLPRDVALGDFNRDNHTDLVIANSGIDNIGIRLGNGNRTFADQITYPTGLGSRPYWVEIGDFNNDTLLDIVVANYGTNNIGLFLGFGNGSFANQSTFSLNFSRPLSIAINDFNNDSQSDIVVSNDGSFYITVLLGFGNGSFQIDMNYYMGHDSAPCSML